MTSNRKRARLILAAALGLGVLTGATVFAQGPPPLRNTCNATLSIACTYLMDVDQECAMGLSVPNHYEQCTAEKWNSSNGIRYAKRRDCLGNLGQCTPFQVNCSN